MKMPIICICTNPRPIQELFFMLRKKFTPTVSARLEYFPETNFLNVLLKQNVPNPEAVVFFETPVSELTQKSMEHLLNPSLSADYNGNRYIIDNSQLLIGTYEKPLLMPKLEKRFLFYVVPEDATAEMLSYFYKIICLDLNLDRLPALRLKTPEADKLFEYYENKKVYYYNKIKQIQERKATVNA